jgi:hypothetical protein
MIQRYDFHKLSGSDSVPLLNEEEIDNKSKRHGKKGYVRQGASFFGRTITIGSHLFNRSSLIKYLKTQNVEGANNLTVGFNLFGLKIGGSKNEAITDVFQKVFSLQKVAKIKNTPEMKEQHDPHNIHKLTALKLTLVRDKHQLGSPLSDIIDNLYNKACALKGTPQEEAMSLIKKLLIMWAALHSFGDSSGDRTKSLENPVSFSHGWWHDDVFDNQPPSQLFIKDVFSKKADFLAVIEQLQTEKQYEDIRDLANQLNPLLEFLKRFEKEAEPR